MPMAIPFVTSPSQASKGIISQSSFSQSIDLPVFKSSLSTFYPSQVRVVVVGDDKVGKSSLISDIVEETFIEQVPPVLSEVFIPPEVTPEHVPTVIVDTSARSEYRKVLETEIQNSDVAVLVYAVDNPATYSRLRSHWLPLLGSCHPEIPVILVANKIDTRGENLANAHLDEFMLPLMSEYKQIETCIECSAKTIMNVSEIFYFALKAVLNPTAPLFDCQKQVLKPACIRAFSRIFKLLDSNNGGYLDDSELFQFQLTCFSTPVHAQDIEEIKETIKEIEPKGVSSNGLTESALQLIFIQRGRLETIWTILRRFGYGLDLGFREDFLHPLLEIGADESVELSPKGYRFVLNLFNKHDRNRDGALGWAELEDMFNVCPGGNPWLGTGFPEGVAGDEGAVTLHGFLTQWTMMALLDPRLTMQTLAYLGFEEDVRNAVKVTPGRSLSLSNGKVGRDVFRVAVIGSSSSGKNALLHRFVEKNTASPKSSEPTGLGGMGVYEAVNTVSYGSLIKHIVMEEIAYESAEHVLGDRVYMARCDLLLLVFNEADEADFSRLSALCKHARLDFIPVVILQVGSGNNEPTKQRCPIQPEEFASQKRWLAPIRVVLSDEKSLESLWQRLVHVLMNPYSAGFYSRETSMTVRPGKQWLIAAAWIGLGVSAVAALGLCAIMAMKTTGRPK